MKKEAKSLHALVDRNSEATDTGGLVSLSTVANKARALFLFLVMMSEKNDCRALFISIVFMILDVCLVMSSTDHT